ncbi:hypothetical protein [Aquabacterium sp.]|uniref:hypothetical protein n=1 Tax=Aquabacterium sp. TaxID=1872578 RepID=UPI003783BF3F
MNAPHDTTGRAGSPAPATLADALARLGADLAAQPVPPLSARARHALGAAARGRGAAVPGGGAARSRWAAWGLSGAALCALALGGSVLLVVLSPQQAPTTTRQAQLASGFVAVASAERWQQLLRDGDAAPAWLVPTEIPRERLAALGLPFDPSRAGDRVSAELLMHPSGEVLAVRVLNP